MPDQPSRADQPAPPPTPFLAVTELRSERTRGLDLLAPTDLVSLLIREQAAVCDAVLAQAGALTAALEAAAERLGATEQGRLVYVGSGTSGRLAETDAAELAPTFGFTRTLAVRTSPAAERSGEPEEDDEQAGYRRLEALALSSADVVVCVAASGRTPFVRGALAAARERDALTIAVVSNPGSPLAAAADQVVELVVGPEPIAGSTRMKAGLAQKLVLTTFSTALMVRLGRTFDNLMVEMAPRLAKLEARQARIVAEACAVTLERSREALAANGGDVKVAILRELTGLEAPAARAALARAPGLRAALASVETPADG